LALRRRRRSRKWTRRTPRKARKIADRIPASAIAERWLLEERSIRVERGLVRFRTQNAEVLRPSEPRTHPWDGPGTHKKRRWPKYPWVVAIKGRKITALAVDTRTRTKLVVIGFQPSNRRSRSY